MNFDISPQFSYFAEHWLHRGLFIKCQTKLFSFRLIFRRLFPSSGWTISSSHGHLKYTRFYKNIEAKFRCKNLPKTMMNGRTRNVSNFPGWKLLNQEKHFQHLFEVVVEWNFEKCRSSQNHQTSAKFNEKSAFKTFLVDFYFLVVLRAPHEVCLLADFSI